MPIDRKEIFDSLSTHLPAFTPNGELQELSGGNLNRVWRLEGESSSVVIKHAPPYIASSPEVPLSDRRIVLEAAALRLFAADGPLHELAGDRLRPPRMLGFDEDRSLLFLEDFGQVPGLDEGIDRVNDPEAVGSAIGRFIGTLHRRTLGDRALARRFDNREIQQARNRLQYQPADTYYSDAAGKQHPELANRTRSLGQSLLEPGRCLVMGDLWPPSLLLEGERMRLIDWEFVHYGRPLQDVAHFAAHCWMQAHAASSAELSERWRAIWNAFWESYRRAAKSGFSRLIDSEEERQIPVHIGAEILVRANGPFRNGYLYENRDILSEEAVRAAAVIIAKGSPDTFWELLP